VLVYGDPKFHSTLHLLCRQLRALALAAASVPEGLDALRSLLIACGQVEQGAHDTLEQVHGAHEARQQIAPLHRATAHAADAFYAAAYPQPGDLPAPAVTVASALQGLLVALDAVCELPDLPLAVKLPEGFSFHALYPEQYLLAAGRWLADHSAQHPRQATVVGIRSIGTSLAAVVAAVLRAGGWDVQSLTVRPSGHPYARQVDLGAFTLNPASLGLVVDEGPGISGSSMAATAEALVRGGLQREGIAFFPGHTNEPGGAGNEDVLTWWRSAPRYVASTDSVTFGGQPLNDALAALLPERVVQIDNYSGGVWRGHVYADRSEWPAIPNFFERTKFCCTLESGRRVLFKYLGLGSMSPDLADTAQAAERLLAARAAQGIGPAPLCWAYGFVALPWVEGVPLTLDSAPADMEQVIGTYIAHTAGPPLADGELQRATARLSEMLYVNTKEALGEQAADLARYRCPTGQRLSPSCGDGRMQPHEWIRTPGGSLVKVDGVGHDCDQTLVGSQPIALDLAGAMVEWRLDELACERLLRAFYAAGGQGIHAGDLQFYRLAYTAFRAGQCALAAEVHDPYERDRLLAAYATYRSQLAHDLGVSA
jgi:hypothetical protein